MSPNIGFRYQTPHHIWYNYLFKAFATIIDCATISYFPNHRKTLNYIKYIFSTNFGLSFTKFTCSLYFHIKSRMGNWFVLLPSTGLIVVSSRLILDMLHLSFHLLSLSAAFGFPRLFCAIQSLSSFRTSFRTIYGCSIPAPQGCPSATICG